MAELSKAIGTHTDQEICEQLKQHEPDVQGLIAVINRELEIGGYYEVQRTIRLGNSPPIYVQRKTSSNSQITARCSNSARPQYRLLFGR